MKFSSQSIVSTLFFVAVVSTTATVEAFSVTTQQGGGVMRSSVSWASSSGTRTVPMAAHRTTARYAASGSGSADSGGNDEVSKLLAAAARAREEAARLRGELGQSDVAVADGPKKAQMTAEQVKALVPSLVSESDATKRVAGWEGLQESSKVFGSANLRTYPVSLKMLDQRTAGILTPKTLGMDGEGDVSLDDFKYALIGVTLGSGALGIAALAFLPSNIGATVCYLVALVPVLFLGVGSSAPGIIANAIAKFKDGNDEDGISKRDRICRHEAAHLCCGYWCGLPISTFDTASDEPCVEFEVASDKYTATQVAALAITGLAGSVGEVMAYQNTKGATQDLMQVETVFKRGVEFYGSAAQQDVTRWAALTAYQLLASNKDKYEQVVKAMQNQASLGECIAILEG